MVQRDEAIDDAAAPAKSRKKKARKAKRPEVQTRSLAGRAARSVLALAGLALVMVVGAMLGRATARA
jgi:hypothetical protein